MSSPDTIVCPECHSVQSGDVPFCDNCGFRLGRPDEAPSSKSGLNQISDVPTQVEPAVTPEDVARYQNASSGAGERSPRSVLAATEVEGYPAVRADQVEVPTRDATEVEGLESVKGADPTEPRNPAVGSMKATPRDSDALLLQSEVRSGGLVLFAAWVVTIVAAVMITAYLVRDSAQGAEELADESVAPSRLQVPAGSLERGLSESVRAFILKTCLKVSDNTDDCDQDELLTGEFPVEVVAIAAFAVDSHEATVGAFEECVAAKKCEPISWRDCKVYTHQGLQVGLRVPSAMKAPDVALTCVDRRQADAYCKWRGGRIPGPDEWEWAARGADGPVFPWGPVWDPTAANWGETDVAQVPVLGTIDGAEWVAAPGRYPTGASPHGVLDMAGNVAEWVASSPPTARGGSWRSTPFELRTTGRLELDETARRTDVGIRCAYD